MRTRAETALVETIAETSPDSVYPVLSRAAAETLAKKVMMLGEDRGATEVHIEHSRLTVTRIANGRILTMDDGDTLTIRFDLGSGDGFGVPITLGTNQVNDALLEHVVNNAQATYGHKPIRPEDREPEEDLQDPLRTRYGPRTFLPVSLWHDTTVEAMRAGQAALLPEVVRQTSAENLQCVATVGLAARSTLYMYKPGLTAYGRETDCEVTMTARTPDYRGSGWNGVAHRDWSAIQPATVARHAIDIANRSRNIQAVEPGRRTAILGPGAVAQLVRAMAPLFWSYTSENPQRDGPFSEPLESGRSSKIGKQVVDPRITMFSDPQDPDGGYLPFLEMGNDLFFNATPGAPVAKVDWIRDGVLMNLVRDLVDAERRKVPFADFPWSMHVRSSGVTTTIDEMIANCKDGVYVNRFSDVDVLAQSSHRLTGVTRDGCFLIRNGKIDRAIKNFRFVELPLAAFNRVEAIGTPVRVPFGTQNVKVPPSLGLWKFPQLPMGQQTRWPRLPVIVPPMMIRDFNFSALIDAA